MNTRSLLRKLLLVPLLLVCFCTSARAFYDASVGRWVNRDPIEEADGSNLYTFVANNSISRYDGNGLFGCRREPCSNPCEDAKSQGKDEGDVGGVVCCGGKAYSCVWKSGGANGAGNSKAKGIVDKCSKKHEDSHQPDVQCPSGPGLSRGGVPKGTGAKLECEAYKIERDCLKSSISGCDGDPQCIKEVLREIKTVNTAIGLYCKP